MSDLPHPEVFITGTPELSQGATQSDATVGRAWPCPPEQVCEGSSRVLRSIPWTRQGPLALGGHVQVLLWQSPQEGHILSSVHASQVTAAHCVFLHC